MGCCSDKMEKDVASPLIFPIKQKKKIECHKFSSIKNTYTINSIPENECC